MNIEDLIIDALHDDKDLDCKSGIVELDGRIWSATCYLHSEGVVSVWLKPTTREEPPGDILVKGEDTIFRFEEPSVGTKTLGKVLVNTGRLV